MDKLREEIEKIIKRDTYAIICSNCSGGGYDYDNQKECEDCNGTGLSEWRLDLPVENILSLIENEKAKQREEIIERFTEKPEEAGWSRAFNERFLKYLTQTGEKEHE